MKKIGILFGMESTFPPAVIERINQKKVSNIMAEAVQIDQVVQGEGIDYAVIIDRISQDVPFYRSFLKNAAICGTAVINNPFWWSADEKFFNNALATKIGVPVPKTVLLPSKHRPPDTTENSFRNLKFPLSWDAIFERIGFPAYMKPHAGGGWKSVYKVNDADDFFEKYSETDTLVMLLQEEINFTDYFRCYCLGGKYVRVMAYEPRNPHHLRYVAETSPAGKALLGTIENHVLALNHALGYDFNTVEFAVRDGVPYAIDFCNPAPDADVYSVGQENFEWVVEHAAKFAIERAQSHQDGKDNLTWGTYLRGAASNGVLPSEANARNTSSRISSSTIIKSVGVSTVSTTPSTATNVTVIKSSTTSKSEGVATKTTSSNGKKSKADDLTIIEGIGPKIAELLKNAGIETFDKLANSSVDTLKAILDAAGSRFRMHDPSTWAEQSKLAADGEMAALEVLKTSLNKGKK